MRETNSFDADQAQSYVEPDMGSNCIQRLSEDGKTMSLAVVELKYSLEAKYQRHIQTNSKEQRH